VNQRGDEKFSYKKILPLTRSCFCLKNFLPQVVKNKKNLQLILTKSEKNFGAKLQKKIARPTSKKSAI